MSDYKTMNSTISSLQNRLVLPKFQRGYVWTQVKQLELIESLHKGYPFGALLTYAPKNSDEEKLLDGQQRWTTIMDFKYNKAKYFKKLEPSLYHKTLDKLNSFIKEGKLVNEIDFDRLLSSSSDYSTDKEDLSDLVDDYRLKYQFSNISSRDIRHTIKNMQDKMNEYLNVDSLEVPIIQYFGSEDNIANVFESLNKGGIKLTKYEIYAAAWDHTEIKLNKSKLQEELLKNVVNFYIEKKEDTENRGLTLDNFSSEEFAKNRVINLYDLGVGLGRMIQSRLPSLVDDTDTEKIQIGFGILGIYSGVDPKTLNKIVSHIKDITDNIEEILKKSTDISILLSNIFDKLIKQNSKIDSSKIGYERGLSTSYKTLSYFASLWNLEKSSDEYVKTVNNIPRYYVYDFVRRVWINAGDTRLYEFYPSRKERTYSTSIDKESFENNFKSWILDENTQQMNFTNRVRSLATIHANLTYLSDFVSFGENLQVEHIYPKQRVLDNDQDHDVILGRIGNAMYLPQKMNVKKKTKTLYEYKPGEYENVMKLSSYPSKTDFSNAFAELEAGNPDIMNELIIDRSFTVAHSIIEKLMNNKF
ncbi:hypothetical protein HW41_03220 [Apilactobacillus kunkeei]|uniref:DUF262 domain-containing protein n=1 Tax=Apilactobacillus kunkeei TaxID=148814 RepID=UPI00059B1B87|nr:DUF262 domain-containing protein [Apilactobacillus kunkeei]KIM18791.1 hypothetical protein HW41_03220 [Apilactobacillus kunkeei]MBI0091984.1 DUF262 domain-containing protein [Lactobacillus sp. M0345]